MNGAGRQRGLSAKLPTTSTWSADTVAVPFTPMPPKAPPLTIVRVSVRLQAWQTIWAGKMVGPPAALLPWLMVVLVMVVVVLLRLVMPFQVAAGAGEAVEGGAVDGQGAAEVAEAALGAADELLAGADGEGGGGGDSEGWCAGPG